ncbi:hypothetical protein EZV73_08215 [Acidaminobacter sp. JC074]|uniref:GTP-binding protein n=1 Tax=Acidaminobacter sp. JC074 TaxID=2530199 RepID=UPI001F0FAA80|nr:GTP-binding protein [Acidaminobacter sp. JC074]MCH4887553.1 hypothetical protein [Acidaminobacter sp. JC074]
MIKIILLSGFLGSGKTTLLNHLIKTMEKTAIIINEYGKESVDDKLVHGDFDVQEISNGSIFCTCRSDQFLNVLLRAKAFDVETILVENSGLADPTGMGSIMDMLEKVSPNTFEYEGSICVLDALNYHKVKSTLPVVKNQVIGSSLIVINKIDLVGDVYLTELTDELVSEGHQVVQTQYGQVDDVIMSRERTLSNGLITKTIGISKLHLDASEYSLEQVEKWLEKIGPLTLRIKGFINDSGHFLVQSVLGDYRVEAWPNSENAFLEIIYKSNDQVKSKILETWKNLL